MIGFRWGGWYTKKWSPQNFHISL